jgi:hypothetical protein
MEFFNKKQDVIDLQLTGYGKQLLSRGMFKPIYYTFSDDDVIYDGRWVTGSNGDALQSDIEARIQEKTPRLKTQYRKVGAERAVFNTIGKFTITKGIGFQFNTNYAQTIQDLLEFTTPQEANDYMEHLNLHINFAESEKLLENLLGTKSFLNHYDPAWNALFYNGEIASSTPYYKKNNIFSNTPQLNCTFKDIGYRIDSKYDPHEVLSKPKIVASGMAQYSNIIPTGNPLDLNTIGSDSSFFEEVSIQEPKPINPLTPQESGVLFIEKDFLFLSLEETNVDYTRDNFMVEIFEVITTSEEGDGEEELIKLFFHSQSDNFMGAVGEVFNIEVDEDINSLLGCYLVGKDETLKTQNVYTTKIFDCQSHDNQTGTSISNPYTNLPEVDVGDTC